MIESWFLMPPSTGDEATASEVSVAGYEDRILAAVSFAIGNSLTCQQSISAQNLKKY